MFGVVRLNEKVDQNQRYINDTLDGMSRRVSTLGRGLEEQMLRLKNYFDKELEVRDQRIDKLTRQIEQLAYATNCKITSPVKAEEGGEVRKMTEKEIKDRERFNSLFTTKYFFPFSGNMQGKSVVSDLMRGKTTRHKKVVTKKK